VGRDAGFRRVEPARGVAARFARAGAGRLAGARFVALVRDGTFAFGFALGLGFGA
jgi:hypothetical protein